MTSPLGGFLFSSFDSFHIILSCIFLFFTLGVILLRYKKYFGTSDNITNYTHSKKMHTIRLASLVTSIMLLGTTLLGPVGLMGDSLTTKEGIDCIWLLDVSASMDVLDVSNGSQTISRLTYAKSLIENFIITHPENQYGLVIFAGNARLVSPLTSEHSSILSFLQSIDSRSISNGGTDFAEALSLAMERFETKDSTSHAVVLLSDGGDDEDTMDKSAMSNIFSGKHTPLLTVGIGKTTPSPIPIGRNPFGDTVYKKYNGETVLSGLNESNLKNLAKESGGSYTEAVSLEKDLENVTRTFSRHSISTAKTPSDDATVRMFIFSSFIFFLIFLLFPSTIAKKGNAI